MTKTTVSDGTPYARKEAYEYEGTKYEADLQDGDTVTIKDEGRIEDGTYGEQHKFVVETRNGDKRASFNPSSINILIDELGEDSKNWIGKKVKVLTKKTVIANKKRVVAYFVTDGWYLDDYGDLENDSRSHDQSIVSNGNNVPSVSQGLPEGGGRAEEAGFDTSNIPF